MYVDAAPVSTVIDNADSPRHIDRNGTLCYNHLAIAGSPYTVFPVTDMQADPNYTPGQTWWDKLWGTIGSWWRSIPKWQKVLVGAIFIAVSIGIAVATCGASVGPEAQLLGGAAAATALATAAKVALIEVSIGIGFAVAGWAINAADTGDWSINALEEAVADSIFFTGLFMFISTSVSAIKYMYRADPYPTPEVAKQYKFKSNAELETHFTQHNQDFGFMYANKQEYLNGANYVIKNGTYVSTMNGYLRYYGVIEKEASYAFVGMTRDGAYITTYGIRRVSKLNKVPWIVR